jgi:Abortive infection alpha
MADDKSSFPLEVYRDLAQPASREVGEAVRRAIRIALAPVRGLLWSLEQAEEYILQEITPLINPSEVADLRTPEPRLLGAVVSGIMTASDNELRRLYVRLLATSMGQFGDTAHPSFAGVISQITPDEARILCLVSSRRNIPTLTILAANSYSPETWGIIVRHVSKIGLEAGVEYPIRTGFYLDNLVRLHLLNECPVGIFPSDLSEDYDRLLKLQDLEKLRHLEKQMRREVRFEKSGLYLTEYGASFAEVCINPVQSGVIYCGDDISDKLEERVIHRLELLERLVGKA